MLITVPMSRKKIRLQMNNSGYVPKGWRPLAQIQIKLASNKNTYGAQQSSGFKFILLITVFLFILVKSLFVNYNSTLISQSIIHLKVAYNQISEMQAIANRPLTFKQQLIFLSKSIYSKLDWKAIDQHESLTFLWKNYHKKPSDVALTLVIVFAIVLLRIDGLNVVKIQLCYMLPICVMIVRFGEVVGYERDRKRVQSDEQKQIREQMPTMKDLNQQFIFYFVLNLVLDLAEPFALLFIQTVFNLFELIFKSVLDLALEGNYWPLILVPLKFVGKFIAHVITFSDVSQQAIVILICLRIVLSAYLLNMNQEKRNYCQKLLFQGKLLSIFSKNQQQNIRPKNQ